MSHVDRPTESDPGPAPAAAESTRLLEALLRLARVIGSGRDMERVFAAFADELARLVPYDRCAFATFDPATDMLHVGHVRSTIPPYDTDGQRVPLGDSVAGRVIREGRALLHVVTSVDQYAQDDVRRARGIAQVAVLPVIVDDAPVGVLALSSARSDAYGEDDLAVLEAIAGHLGLAVAGTNLRRAAEGRAVRDRFLATVAGELAATVDPAALLAGVLTRGAELLGDVNAVFVRDEATGGWALRALTRGAGTLSERMRDRLGAKGVIPAAELDAVAAGRPLLLPDAEAMAAAPGWRAFAAELGVRALLAVPMVAGGEEIGVLCSARTAPTEPFTADDVALARELATAIAAALRNARLHLETRRALDESEALRRIGQELSRSVDPAEVIRLVSTFARLLLGVDYAAVAVEEPDGALVWRGVVGNRSAAHEADRFERGRGLVGRAIVARRPVVIQDFGEDPAFPAGEFSVVWAEGMRAAVAVPMTVGGRGCGALVVGHRAPRRFARAEVRLLESLAAQAAIALEHARLFAAARRAIAERDRFLSVAAHELRTPLTTLKGRAQLLRRRLAERATPADLDALRVMVRQLDRLSRMVDDLLDASRLETGRLALRREPADLGDLVRRAVDEANGLTDAPRVTLETTEAGLVAEVDPGRLEQVLANLLDNAHRYSPPNAPILVRLRREGEAACIEVIDRGRGLTPEHLARIFEPFASVEAENAAGVGFGLAVSRQVVADHGGRLWATSEGPGRGSTFVVLLPLVSAAPVPESSRPTES